FFLLRGLYILELISKALRSKPSARSLPMAAIATHVHHPPAALSRCGPPSNPFLRFAPSPSILLRSRAAATPPLAPIGARSNNDDPISYPEPRKTSLGLSPLLVAVAAAAT
uniref:Uncharacterized protein n=1 Tax=Aegilops tauschii subsp. strangulata TaxID=200361 RepID=A0A453S1I3_AEGTS